MPKVKKQDKIIMYVGMILIIVSFLHTFILEVQQYEDEIKTEQIVEKMFENVTPPIIDDTNVENESANLSLTNKYLGYIEIPSYGIKRLIIKGTETKDLDKGLVGMMDSSINIDDENGTIFLAGHNSSNVFRALHYLKIGDEIKIVSHKGTYFFEVLEKHTIKDTDMSYFTQRAEGKLLTLITCENNNSYRLVVIAKPKA